MTEVHNSNTACCSIPTVQHEYHPKGKYEAYSIFDKVYVTGPSTGDKAVVVVYDIFGFFPQTIQGADIIAETIGARVVMPDFLRDKPFPLEKFPPKTEEGKKELQEFFGGVADLSERLPELLQVGEQLKQDGFKKVGTLGFCWGGKMTIQAGSKNTFDAVATAHPAFLSVDDVKDLNVPLGLYPSKDEPIEEFDKMAEAMSKNPFAAKNSYKVYRTMQHGFAAARADLKDDEGLAQFEDVYGRISAFFKGALED